MSILILIAAFCGGALGAILGGLLSYILIGFIGLAGVAVMMFGSSYNMLGLLSFGYFYGPQIGFVGGVGAAAYARSKGWLASGKDVFTPLISLKKPSVILFGGLLGVAGAVVFYLLGLVAVGKIDLVASTIIIVTFFVKIIFDRSIFGDEPEEVKKAGGRFSSISPIQWIPYVSTVTEKTLVGLIVGFGATWVTYTMLLDPTPAVQQASIYLPFFIGTLTLMRFYWGTAIPVTHHICICASYGIWVSGGNILWGVVGGLLAAHAGDLGARTLMLYGKKIGGVWIDPPTCAVMIVSFCLFTIFPALGIYKGQLATIIPIAIIVVAVIWSVVESVQMSKQVSEPANI
ncbi:MAG TPA: hypothetical protein VM577_13395 [Anaerovoracaceae bacterium]|nr:hypothetical protein [Anaerovoracaceae bacterium]